MEPNIKIVTVTNVIEAKTVELAIFINSHVLSYKLPIHTVNSPLSVRDDLIPLLSIHSNNKAYVNELYNIILSYLYEQKKFKRTKNPGHNADFYSDLEAKLEILYRTMQTLDRMYEATSRLMTGVGSPDNRDSRF